MAENRSPTVLDIRSADEWNDGHIANAVHFYAGRIVQGELPPLELDREIAVICGAGYRSTVVTGSLRRAGWLNLVNVIGGTDTWNMAAWLRQQRGLLEVDANAGCCSVVRRLRVGNERVAVPGCGAGSGK